MKHFLHLLIFLLPFTALAQAPVPIDKKTGHIVYNGTIDAKGVSQSELYLRIKAFYNTYKAGDDVIQLLQDNTNRISGKTFTDVIVNDGTSTERQRLWFTLTVEMGDGRLSYEVRNFSLQRHCIPARQIPCEVQTKLTAVEAILKPAGKKKAAKSASSQAYAPETALEKATTTIIAALEAGATTERRIAGAGVKPE